MKIKLTKVFRSNKDKEGNILKTKDGREYEKLAIKCQEYGEKWVSGFSGAWNYQWREGDTVEADIEEVEGGKYLNLKKPDPIAELKVRVQKLEQAVFNMKPKLEATPTNNDDNPFDQ